MAHTEKHVLSLEGGDVTVNVDPEESDSDEIEFGGFTLTMDEWDQVTKFLVRVREF